MSFSPIVRVRKFIDKMKTERESPRLKRFISRSASGSVPEDEVAHISKDSMDWSSYEGKMEYPKENYIQNLPSEALLLIFSYLEVKDLLKARSVSQYWYDLADVNVLWKGLCDLDWNVCAPLEDTWKHTYMRLESLFSEGNWEGMSKWLEPEGYDNEQKTTAKLHFQKRRRSNAPVKVSSPTPIHRVDSSANSNVTRNFKDSTFRISGSGVTINCASHSYFRIDGERVDSDSYGATFKWYKQFEKHTSVYVGKVDYMKGTVSGSIDYHDGTTHWKGVFHYMKSNKKYSKQEEMQLA